MIFIGCDPGLTGAMAVIDTERGLLECADVPTCGNGLESGSMKRWVDESTLTRLLKDWSARHQFAHHFVRPVIERPIPMPTLPAQTIASQFDTFGVLRAALGRHGEVAYVTPQAWKKLYGIGNDKDRAREVAANLYPAAPVGRVKDHNRAESILIGHFGARTMA